MHKELAFCLKRDSGGIFENCIDTHFSGIFLCCTVLPTKMLQDRIVKKSTTTTFQAEIKLFVNAWVRIPRVIDTSFKKADPQ